jgi:hypothetical protein
MDNKDFAPYQPSLDMKGLGFDEPCFGYYENDVLIFCYDSKQDYELLLNCAAPLYQQAFRWFREKYKIFSCIMTEYSYGGNISAYHINGLHQSNISKGDFYNYEEAELACLKELIEIVKNK